MPKRLAALRASIRSIPVPIWVLALGTGINQFGNVIPIFLALYLVSKGLSISQAGLAVAVFGATSLVGVLAGGQLNDRVGPRRVIVLTMLLSAGSALGLGFAGDFTVILALLTAYGLTSQMVRPAVGAVLGSAVDGSHRVIAAAVLRFAFNAGYAVGPLIVGLLVGRSFISVFLIDALTSVGFAVAAAVGLRESSHGVEKHSVSGGYGDVLRDARFMTFLTGFILLALVVQQSTLSLPLHLRQSGYSASEFGLLISLNGLIVVLFELPLTTLTKDKNRSLVMALGAMLVGLGFALTGGTRDLVQVVLTVLIWSLGEILVMPRVLAHAADVAPAHLRGRYQGSFSFAFAAGRTAGPLTGSLLFGAGELWLWISCVLFGTAAAVLLLRGASTSADCS